MDAVTLLPLCQKISSLSFGDAELQQKIDGVAIFRPRLHIPSP